MRNLSYDVKDADIEDHFAGCGKIVGVRIIYDNGNPKGFGYVEFEDLEGLKNALEQDHPELCGRKPFVAVGKKKNP